MKHFLSIIMTLFACICCGKVYYVSKSGNDSYTCSQASNPVTPKLHIASALGCLSAGDTLYIRAGVYTESMNEYNVTVPSGSSWAMPVTIAGYPGDSVTLQPASGATEVIRLMGASGTKYVIFNNLILDGVNGTDNCVKITYTGSDPSNNANHIRIQNSELKNSSGNGIFVDNGSAKNEFIGLKIHDNGSSDFSHGIYITGTANLVYKCKIYQNAGWGVHVYSDLFSSVDSNVIKSNLIYRNAKSAGRGAGIILSAGKGNMAYNNIVWGNNGGVQVDYGAENALVYNNTICENNGGNQGNAVGILIGSEASGTRAINDISWNNVGGNLQDGGSASVMSNNLMTYPLFKDTATDDFHLLAGSAAIDAGADLSAVLTVDYDGVARPQGAAFDIGAYEYYVQKIDTTDTTGTPINPNNPDSVKNVDTASVAVHTILVYPNPAKGTLFVRLPADTLPDFRLYSVEGIMVIESRLTKTPEDIDVSYLQKGVYVYELILNRKRLKRGKIVVDV